MLEKSKTFSSTLPINWSVSKLSKDVWLTVQRLKLKYTWCRIFNWWGIIELCFMKNCSSFVWFILKLFHIYSILRIMPEFRIKCFFVILSSVEFNNEYICLTCSKALSKNRLVYHLAYMNNAINVRITGQCKTVVE